MEICQKPLPSLFNHDLAEAIGCEIYDVNDYLMGNVDSFADRSGKTVLVIATERREQKAIMDDELPLEALEFSIDGMGTIYGAYDGCR